MNRIQKIKQNIKDHRHEILAVAFVGSLVTLVIAADIAVAKQEAEAKKELDKYIIEQNRQGRTVVKLANGTFIGVTI